MKHNKVLSLSLAAMLAMGTLTGCLEESTDFSSSATQSSETQSSEKTDITVSVTGESEGVVTATYSGSPIAVTTSSEQSVTLTVKYTGVDGTTYAESETAPTDAGKYSVSISYAGDDSYNAYSSTLSLVIEKASNVFTVEMSDYVYGATGSLPTVTGNKAGDVTFVYAGTGNTVYAESANLPTSVGSYKVTATTEETNNYLAGSAEDTFSIQKAAGSLAITMADYTTLNTDAEPVVSTNLSGGAVTYVYEGTGDTEYVASSVKPTAAGTYIVTATAEATDSYEEATANASFTVVAPAREDVPTAAPVLDTDVMVLNDSFSIVAEADTEYRVVTEGGTVACDWQSTGTFSGLNGKTKYFVEARRPATAIYSPSEIGAAKLEVTTLEGALANDFERLGTGTGVGNFVVSADKAHNGNNSIKCGTPDGTYGFILQPNALLERDDNGNKYNGYWASGSYEENYINVQGYKYLSFWAYFEQDVAIGQGVEIWKTDGGDVFNCGVGQTVKGGSWQRVVIDMTVNGVLRGTYDDICSHIAKIYFNFAWVPASEIGTFYIDEITFIKGETIEEEKPGGDTEETAGEVLATDFEKMAAGSGLGNFVVSSDKAHNGVNSMKSATPDGNGFILQPQCLLDYADANGSWATGSYEENYVDISGYKYISFWVYFENDVTLSDGIEIWKEVYGDVFNCGVGLQIKGGSWQKVVIDMTVNGVLRGSYDDICSHVGRIYFNFGASCSTVGTFYIDEITFSK